MRKLAILLGLVGAVGFASLALAAPGVVTIQCATFTSSTVQNIFGFQADSTLTTPLSCTPGATSSCAQCINDLRSVPAPNTWFVQQPVDIDSTSGYAGAYFILFRF